MYADSNQKRKTSCPGCNGSVRTCSGVSPSITMLSFALYVWSVFSFKMKKAPFRGLKTQKEHAKHSISPDSPQESGLQKTAMYSDSGRLNASAFSVYTNDRKRHNVRLRRLGTVGICPFQKLCFTYMYIVPYPSRDCNPFLPGRTYVPLLQTKKEAGYSPIKLLRLRINILISYKEK